MRNWQNAGAAEIGMRQNPLHRWKCTQAGQYVFTNMAARVAKSPRQWMKDRTSQIDASGLAEECRLK
jgi:hypothetical protein